MSKKVGPGKEARERGYLWSLEGVLSLLPQPASECLVRPGRRLPDPSPEAFGLWRVRFPPCLVRPGRRVPVQGLSRREGSPSRSDMARVSHELTLRLADSVGKLVRPGQEA